MRRDVRDVLTAWVIGLAAIVALLLVTIGCGTLNRGLVDPDDEIEALLVSETARHAATLGVRVEGQLVSTCPYTEGRLGWYEGGIAYYYRPLVEKQVVVARGDRCPDYPRCEAATNIAAHEVCHAKYRAHDLAHWTCNNTLAQATYPRPE